jgi:hypothetical protein
LFLIITSVKIVLLANAAYFSGCRNENSAVLLYLTNQNGNEYQDGDTTTSRSMINNSSMSIYATLPKIRILVQHGIMQKRSTRVRQLCQWILII